MRTDKNIQEIKELLPDYLKEKLSPDEKTLVENYLTQSEELRNELDEMRSMFELIDNISYKNPDERYWNNLLPKIHDRINKQHTPKKHFIFWKIILPAAAVLLIAIFLLFDKKGNEEFTVDTKVDFNTKENKKYDDHKTQDFNKDMNIQDNNKNSDIYSVKKISKKTRTSDLPQNLEDTDDLVTIILESDLTYSNGDILKEEDEDVIVSTIDGDDFEINNLDDDFENLDEEDKYKILEDLNNYNL